MEHSNEEMNFNYPSIHLSASKHQLFGWLQKWILICINFSRINQVDEKPQVSVAQNAQRRETTKSKKCGGVFCIIFLILNYINVF